VNHPSANHGVGDAVSAGVVEWIHAR
jgi:hypothetical protein